MEVKVGDEVLFLLESGDAESGPLGLEVDGGTVDGADGEKLHLEDGRVIRKAILLTHICKKCQALYREVEPRDGMTFAYVSDKHCEPACSTTDIVPLFGEGSRQEMTRTATSEMNVLMDKLKDGRIDLEAFSKSIRAVLDRIES